MVYLIDILLLLLLIVLVLVLNFSILFFLQEFRAFLYIYDLKKFFFKFFQIYIFSWKVRAITSFCCCGVNLTKLTAYPETRMVRFG